jgi:Ni,Fe-hydrogenase maturation factor
VIGYGNTLRTDDGVGPYVATAVASWGLPGVVSVGVHQLTPELSELLASAELAVFVDARLATLDRRYFRVGWALPTGRADLGGQCPPYERTTHTRCAMTSADRRGAAETVEIIPLEHSAESMTNGHICNPKSLLALARTVYRRSPRSWLVTVPAADFSLGEGLTKTAAEGAEQALDQIAALVGAGLDGGPEFG